MGTDPFVKSWWFLEADDGSWLADEKHELFTRDPNAAMKWPNKTHAGWAKNRLHHRLWMKIVNITEHVWPDAAETPTPADRAHTEGWHESGTPTSQHSANEINTMTDTSGLVEAVARIIDPFAFVPRFWRETPARRDDALAKAREVLALPALSTASQQIAALQADKERLEEAAVAISGFAGHDDRCAQAMWALERRECDCGYTSAHQKLPAALLNREG